MDFQLNFQTDTIDQCHPAEPLCLAATVSVRDALRCMQERNRGAALICREQVVVGIFTERDALKIIAAGTGFDEPLERVMTRNPRALLAGDTVGEAIAAMTRGGYRRLPIVDERGRPTGIIRVTHILHYLVEHFPAVIYNLPPQPHYATQQREGA
jgi:CBS domain-containing protein